MGCRCRSCLIMQGVCVCVCVCWGPVDRLDSSNLCRGQTWLLDLWRCTRPCFHISTAVTVTHCLDGWHRCSHYREHVSAFSVNAHSKCCSWNMIVTDCGRFHSELTNHTLASYPMSQSSHRCQSLKLFFLLSSGKLMRMSNARITCFNSCW